MTFSNKKYVIFCDKKLSKNLIKLSFKLKKTFQVEFRFNVGSGTFLARSKEPVTLHDWHTLHIYRDEREGRLSLDDQQEIVGLSPGAFRGLDLDGDLYVGGVPTDKVLNKELEFIKSKTGFYGKIFSLKNLSLSK